jgi:hypothetical protein
VIQVDSQVSRPYVCLVSCDVGMTIVHDVAWAHPHTEAQIAVTSMTWNGTLIEELELIAAVERNCECVFDKMGMRLVACAAHTMLVRDQRALNGLLWTRRLANQRLAEEGITAP